MLLEGYITFFEKEHKRLQKKINLLKEKFVLKYFFQKELKENTLSRKLYDKFVMPVYTDMKACQDMVFHLQMLKKYDDYIDLKIRKQMLIFKCIIKGAMGDSMNYSQLAELTSMMLNDLLILHPELPIFDNDDFISMDDLKENKTIARNAPSEYESYLYKLRRRIK